MEDQVQPDRTQTQPWGGVFTQSKGCRKEKPPSPMEAIIIGFIFLDKMPMLRAWNKISLTPQSSHRSLLAPGAQRPSCNITTFGAMHADKSTAHKLSSPLRAAGNAWSWKTRPLQKEDSKGFVCLFFPLALDVTQVFQANITAFTYRGWVWLKKLQKTCLCDI